MGLRQTLLLLGTVGVVLVLTLGLVRLQASPPQRDDDARAGVPDPPAHVDHANFFTGSFEDARELTRACLRCHEQQGQDFLQTQHWTWLGDVAEVDGQPVPIGKRNLINNFCISVESNWAGCTSCHAGYGWDDASFDFDDPARIDCLICHDQSGGYAKRSRGAGWPAEGVDLLAAARSVGRPTRMNCGRCHFSGGGGDAVKHGDLDPSLFFPTEAIDVHMGRLDFSCTDCHRTVAHRIPGRSISVSVSGTQRIGCTDCHAEQPHGNARLDAHSATVACQTCHIPMMARREATRTWWDWSQSGRDDVPEDPLRYLKIKGSFRSERNVVPQYLWFDGRASRYLKGDPVVEGGITPLNPPRGGIGEPEAKIWPFKVHRGLQPYDLEFGHLLIPYNYGPGGYWETFDRDTAFRQAAGQTGLAYSGRFGFTETEMYWPLSHMVVPHEQSLQCPDCHGADGRLDWQALGYDGDPARKGGRFTPGGVR